MCLHSGQSSLCNVFRRPSGRRASSVGKATNFGERVLDDSPVKAQWVTVPEMRQRTLRSAVNNVINCEHGCERPDCISLDINKRIYLSTRFCTQKGRWHLADGIACVLVLVDYRRPFTRDP